MINSSIVISVTFSLDEITVDALSGLEVDPTDGINDAEFWAIEAEFNGVIEYDDRAQDGVDTDGVIINGQPTDEEYLLREKWRARMYMDWHYCKNHWTQKDTDYYAVAA